MTLSLRVMDGKRFIRFLIAPLCLIGITVIFFHILALGAVKTLPDSLSGLLEEVRKPQLKDREGRVITVTYANRWNSGSYAPLHQIPDMIKRLFILSEDKRFYSHHGVDWLARFHALVQNLLALRSHRGGSTITEQVVRMIHPRPRSLWSRYLEGCEARMLEQKHTKADIFEFYLNQVPYAANRRGIVQASLYYFNRSTETLTLNEMIALVVLVRAPSYYDPYKEKSRLQGPMKALAKMLLNQQLLPKEAFTSVASNNLILEKSVHGGDVSHFARFVRQTTNNAPSKAMGVIGTTLDLSLQARVSALMEKLLHTLAEKKATNGACLVANHETGEILAWVSGSAASGEKSGRHIDWVTSPRQPGSSLKPFLYALAMEKGWSAAHAIEDAPLSHAVGRGLHSYHNYSRVHYGWVTLREALGNSLNIPAVKAIRFVGCGAYLERLREIGFKSLDKSADFYGEGLALGSGEVTLLEMVQAYSALANQGIFRPLRVTQQNGQEPHPPYREKAVYSEETASLIGNILADPNARKLEFGGNGLLNFPVETAVKTGTSTDYRDSWAVGYNYRYVVGVWMGNADAQPTKGVTGSMGPALLLRSVFAELNRNQDTRPLFISPKLVRREVGRNGDDPKDPSIPRFEWFQKGSEPQAEGGISRQGNAPLRWIRPVNGLEMAMDPRIPDEKEAFMFEIGGASDTDSVTWILDGNSLTTSAGSHCRWFLTRGGHELQARVESTDGMVHRETDAIRFVVK